MTEEWRRIDIMPSHEVSSIGRVRSGTGRILPMSERNGYLKVSFWRDRHVVTRSVHVLVLTAFSGPRPPGYVVRHLDGDKHNNVVSNLAWGTHKENVADSIRLGRHARGERVAKAKLTKSEVRSIRYSAGCGLSHKELGSLYGVAASTIGAVVSRRTWRHVA